MSPERADAETLCADDCEAACCTNGAFLRPADVATLIEAGHGDAVGHGASQSRTDGDNQCVLLDSDCRCRVYEQRPLDCRLFPFGYVLDDARRVVHIVLVGCPLSENYTSEERQQLVERGRSSLTEFDAESLRQYDELAFSSDYESLTTIPYNTLPHDL